MSFIYIQFNIIINEQLKKNWRYTTGRPELDTVTIPRQALHKLIPFTTPTHFSLSISNTDLITHTSPQRKDELPKLSLLVLQFCAEFILESN